MGKMIQPATNQNTPLLSDKLIKAQKLVDELTAIFDSIENVPLMKELEGMNRVELKKYREQTDKLARNLYFNYFSSGTIRSAVERKKTRTGSG